MYLSLLFITVKENTELLFAADAFIETSAIAPPIHSDYLLLMNIRVYTLFKNFLKPPLKIIHESKFIFVSVRGLQDSFRSVRGKCQV